MCMFAQVAAKPIILSDLCEKLYMLLNSKVK
jgi:hypothetical protein